MIKYIKKNYIQIIIAVAIAMISSLFFIIKPLEVYPADDLPFHLNRIEGIVDAIRDGQILPKLYPFSNYEFGYASPLFYCDLFFYPFAFLYFLGVPLIICYKIMQIVIAIATSIIVYVLSKKVFRKDTTSLLIVALYMLSNYRFCDVYYRCAMGELLAFMILPLAIYAIYKVLYLRKNSFILLGVSFSLLVMSHLITSVLLAIIFLFFIVVFIIKHIKERNVIKDCLITISKATIIGLLLCSWFILPMVEQFRNQIFYVNVFSKSDNGLKGYVLLKDAISSNPRHFSFGLILPLMSLTYLFSKRNRLITTIYLLSIFFFALALNIIPFPSILSFIQFSFRLFIVILPLLCIVIGYSFNCIDSNKISKGLLIALLSIVIVKYFYLFYFYSKGKFIEMKNINDNSVLFVDEYSDMYYDHARLGGGEYLPVCNNEDFSVDDRGIVISNLSGMVTGEIYNYDRYFSQIVFDYKGEEGFASLPLTYYKGYKAYCDNIGIDCVNDEVFKKVGLYLKNGDHTYKVKYEGTWVQHSSLVISVLTLIILLVDYIRKARYLNDN